VACVDGAKAALTSLSISAEVAPKRLSVWGSWSRRLSGLACGTKGPANVIGRQQWCFQPQGCALPLLGCCVAGSARLAPVLVTCRVGPVKFAIFT